MKSLIIIYTALAVTVAGGLVYMDRAINAQIERGTGTLNTLKAEDDYSMQPFRAALEDEVTAKQLVQPADYSKQTTMHYYHMQGTQPRLQSDRVILQAGESPNRHTVNNLEAR